MQSCCAADLDAKGRGYEWDTYGSAFARGMWVVSRELNPYPSSIVWLLATIEREGGKESETVKGGRDSEREKKGEMCNRSISSSSFLSSSDYFNEKPFLPHKQLSSSPALHSLLNHFPSIKKIPHTVFFLLKFSPSFTSICFSSFNFCFALITSQHLYLPRP